MNEFICLDLLVRVVYFDFLGCFFGGWVIWWEKCEIGGIRI